MKLIVGLGNRGEEYQNNRHNVGFMMIDYMKTQSASWRTKFKVQNHSLKLKTYKKFNSEICELNFNNEKMVLTKPQSFMNNSGQVVKSCVVRYTLNVAQDLYVAHDDLDLRLGEFKIQKGKGPKLHNGILSVEKTLGTSDFWRIRIGVDNRRADNRIPGEKYVLQNFSGEELKILEEVFNKIARPIISCLTTVHIGKQE